MWWFGCFHHKLPPASVIGAQSRQNTALHWCLVRLQSQLKQAHTVDFGPQNSEDAVVMHANDQSTRQSTGLFRKFIALKVFDAILVCGKKSHR